jgi:hypothetical protein
MLDVIDNTTMVNDTLLVLVNCTCHARQCLSIIVKFICLEGLDAFFILYMLYQDYIFASKTHTHGVA